MFYLCESEAAATNVFICAKAKRRQQIFLSVRKASATNVLSVRKRSVSNKCFYLCESEAAATNIFICAKAKRQQQMFYLCESEASATNVFICASEAAATMRQPELKSPHALIYNGREMGWIDKN